MRARAWAQLMLVRAVCAVSLSAASVKIVTPTSHTSRCVAPVAQWKSGPPIDDDRRQRSPGLQNNFHDTSTADFKRPYGTVGAASAEAPPSCSAAPAPESSSEAAARDTSPRPHSEVDQPRDEELEELNETFLQQQAHISELTTQNSELMRSLRERTEECSKAEVRIALTPAPSAGSLT